MPASAVVIGRQARSSDGALGAKLMDATNPDDHTLSRPVRGHTHRRARQHASCRHRPEEPLSGRTNQRDGDASTPRLRLLSLDAGVHSTLLLPACAGLIPRFNYIPFADACSEPKAVYDNPPRLTRGAANHGTPTRRIPVGNIRPDVMTSTVSSSRCRFTSSTPTAVKDLPAAAAPPSIKIRPLNAEARCLLGHPHPKRIPRRVLAEQVIGISVHEFHRATDSGVIYLKCIFPLLDLGRTRDDCLTYLSNLGWSRTSHSACVGYALCGNAEWRDTDLDAWVEAVEFDNVIRCGYSCATTACGPLHGQYSLHSFCHPLRLVDIGGMRDVEHHGDPDGCSPWACRSGIPVRPAAGTTDDLVRAV